MNQVNNGSTQEKNTGVAILLSLLITGAGQVYNGNTERGIIQIVVYVILWILTVTTGVAALIFIPYWIWGMVDANNFAKDFNQKLHENVEQAEEEARTTIKASDFVEQLSKVASLHSSGLLNDAEYSTKKENLINQLMTKKTKESTEDFLSALIPLIEKKFLSEEEISKIKSFVL